MKSSTIIINQSLKTGIFPDAVKIAKVKPLFKKGDNFCLNIYTYILDTYVYCLKIVLL